MTQQRQIRIHARKQLTPGHDRHDAWDGTGSRVLDDTVPDDYAHPLVEDIVDLEPAQALEIYRKRIASGMTDLGSPPASWLIGHGEPFD